MADGKKTKGRSPQAKTRELLERAGFRVDVCERRVWSHVTKDLFGMFDLVALKPSVLAGVQVTSWDHHADRLKKVILSADIEAWLRSGSEAWIVSWKGEAFKSERVALRGNGIVAEPLVWTARGFAEASSGRGLRGENASEVRER